MAFLDVVMNCPHVWEQGVVGHGGTCTTDWSVVGGGGALCGVVALLIAGLLFFAMRTAPEGRTRGD